MITYREILEGRYVPPAPDETIKSGSTVYLTDKFKTAPYKEFTGEYSDAIQQLTAKFGQSFYVMKADKKTA
jgi:hypothetical protein